MTRLREARFGGRRKEGAGKSRASGPKKLEKRKPARAVQLAPLDRALVASASRLIARRYQPGRHHIAAAVRTKSGKVYLGLHLDTYVGRASVCAEASAVARALTAGADPIVCTVSVRHPRPTEPDRRLQVVSPCGICREMLMDFAPQADVILQADGALKRLPIAALLPLKYRRQP
jgi:cytidine deaminase